LLCPHAGGGGVAMAEDQRGAGAVDFVVELHAAIGEIGHLA
jgi:hypothetical protein